MKSGSESAEQVPLLRVVKLSKQYMNRELPAVRALSLLLQPAELAALVGPSGSGKTTLMRLLAGLEQPDEGSVMFRNKPVAGPEEQLVPGHPGIRLVHQHFELAHRQTVYQNIAQKLRHLPALAQGARTHELLEVCRLSLLADKKVEELSGGEKQRLALGRTLAEEPELLLLDEPFSNLDPALKEEISQEVFSYIRGRGIAAILVSHDPKDALSLADKLWVMQEGQVVQQGSPRELYYKAVSPQVAVMFGKMNIVPKESLGMHVRGEALDFMHMLPEACLLGIRPEAIQQVNMEEAHLKGIIQQSAFHGALTEIKIQIGKSLIMNAYLPAYDLVGPSEELAFKLRLDQIQVWPRN